MSDSKTGFEQLSSRPKSGSHKLTDAARRVDQAAFGSAAFWTGAAGAPQGDRTNGSFVTRLSSCAADTEEQPEKKS
jgi:hypothetical protein